ncbi:hypothetical protein BKA69DRAFT_1166623 [Paraphysoderma sedebokerense]|nr:hypothetical protein BKA69DRAFT_1166623 [Paraphysoderma sedebokerense]
MSSSSDAPFHLIQPPARPPLLGSQDLLSLFNLNHLYEQYVRPYIPNPANPVDTATPKPPEMDPTFQDYVKELPGKPSKKSSKFFQDLIMQPPKSTNVEIVPLQSDAMELAFTLRPGPAENFDKFVLGIEEESTESLSEKVEDTISEKKRKKKRKSTDDGEPKKKKKKKKHKDGETASTYI